MKALALILGYLCVNAAIWVLSMASILPVGGVGPADPSNFTSWFDISVFSVTAGVVGGGIITLLALITKSYALGTAVLVLWVLGVVFQPIYYIFAGLPFLLNAILPPEIWFITQAFVGLSAFLFFVFFVGIIAGRDIFE